MTLSKRNVGILAVIIVFIALAVYTVFSIRSQLKNSEMTQPIATLEQSDQRSVDTPEFATEVVLEGLSNVWDVDQAPDGTIYYTERANKISAIIDGQPKLLYESDDVVVRGEGGMLGMTLDPDFANNRYLYACFNTAQDIRVARFRVTQDNSSLQDRTDIVTGMPVNPSGRHSGCRPVFGPDTNLWIGTGDVAQSEHPQSKTSLGGKVLRVDRDGQAVEGNQGDGFDPRVFSYGHRNVQGVAFYAQPRGDVIGYNSEHGPTRDDEVNVLSTGNFGWDPGPGYDESVDMTDLKKFPDAISAVWKSGDPAIAISGAAIIQGERWKAWDGRLALAVQKRQHVRLLDFANDGKTLLADDQILSQHGRIRTLTMGNDQALYFTTDNGRGQDKIIKLTPNQ